MPPASPSAALAENRPTADQPRVEVLLSTCNGARFLPAQLDSILAQDYPKVAIRVRDDGSTDGTRAILRDYAGRAAVSVDEGPNLGAAASFLALLSASAEDAAYFAFADQDDVWVGNKLSRAVRALEAGSMDEPALYCTEPLLVDAELRPLPGRRRAPPRPGFRNALVENIAPGCTMVLNRAARNLLLRTPAEARFSHDWWTYQVVAGTGRVLFDPVPSVQYRQHETNLVGRGRLAGSQWLKRMTLQLRGWRRGRVRRQAEALRAGFYDALRPENRAILDAFLEHLASPRARLRYALTAPRHRHAPLDDWAFRLVYALNWV